MTWMMSASVSASGAVVAAPLSDGERMGRAKRARRVAPARRVRYDAAMQRAPWLAVALLVGCHESSSSSDRPPAPEVLVPPSATAPSPPATSARAPSAPAPARAPHETASQARASRALALVHAWNAAINAHDTALLAPLYADPVELYGVSMPRARALAAKQAAFARHDRDALSSIEVTAAGHAQFDKKSTGRDGKVLDVTGYLDLREVAGAGAVGGTVHFVIAAEGDTTTDANLERAKASRCEAAVSRLVYATAEARKAEHDIEEGAKGSPDVHVGGMVLPPEPGAAAAAARWRVSVCESRPERMLCLHHFEVDAVTGVVTYTGLESAEETRLATDAALVARVEAACR